MRIPLLMNAYGDSLLITANKKIIRNGLPFKPYLIAEKPNQHLKAIEIKAIRIPDNTEVTMFKMEADTVQLNDEKAKQLQMEGKSFCKLPYLEQLYVDIPDHPLQFPNTDELDILYLDIEVLTKGDGIFPRANKSPIIAIGCKHNNNSVQIFDRYTRGNDEGLLLDFLEYYRSINPDVIVTYNGTGFDLPYIIERMNKYKIDLNQLGRYGTFKYKEGQEDFDFNGRVHLDCIVPARKDQSLFGIKSRGLKAVSAWYGFKALTLGDEVENTQALIGTPRLREYLESDVEATKVVSDVYLPNSIALAELMQVPLGSIVGCFPSFIPKIICARHCKSLNLVPLDSNKDRYGNTREDEDGKPTGEVEPGRIYTLGSRFQGAIVEARKFGYIKDLKKVDFACVDSETELMTDEGWIKAKSIKGTEKLLTFNGPSNQLTFQDMDNWNSYDYNGDMINIKNRYIDQLVTPNHRVCYRNARKENIKWQFKEASKVPTYIKIPVSAFTISHQQIESTKLKYLVLLPWIITEGNITSNSITISQRYTVNKDNCIMLDIICKDLINEEDLYIRNRKNRPDREYTIRGQSYKILINLLENNTRRIPSWVYHVNFAFRRQFISDLIKGDGHKYTEEQPGVYVSKEEKLIDDIQLLCHISGLRALKSEEYTDQRNGCKWFYLHITAESEVHVGLNRTYPTKETLFKKIKYIGKVYCPSIPNTTFMIRRNGKISITGNSMYPSAIRTWNLGPDTTRITGLKDYTGRYAFYRMGKSMVLEIPDENFNKNIEVTIDMSKVGFLKAEIEKLTEERKRLKALMKEANTKAETDAYDSRQIAVKVIMNSIFGYMGSAYANYSDMATGLAITGMCRWTSRFVSSTLGDSIVNIDTDGFIVDRDQDVDQVNAKIAEYIKDHQGVTSYMSLEKEDIIDGYFYRMKNYAVRKLKKGKIIVEKHGVAFKSSKQAGVCDTIMDKVCQMTLDQSAHDPFKTAMDLKNLKQYPLSAFKFRVTFSKGLDGYKNGMSLQRAIGLQVQERLKTDIEDGLQVDYFVTKEPPPCKSLIAELANVKAKKKGSHYTISQYVTSADQLDEEYYQDQIDKIFAIFNWKISAQQDLFNG